MSRSHHRANVILPHHSFQQSLGAPLAHVQGTVVKIYAGPENHHGANHQHFDVKIEQVLSLQGADFSADSLVGSTVFVAVRFGDNEGLNHEIEDLSENTPIELQGEYITAGEAYKTEDNDTTPPLPVLHFTHHPVGFVIYDNQHYS